LGAEIPPAGFSLSPEQGIWCPGGGGGGMARPVDQARFGMRNALDLGVERDSDGHLADPDTWSPELARRMASEWNDFELTDEHLAILQYMRQWFEAHQIVPDVRDVTKHQVESTGMTKKEAKRYLFEYFPHGYMQQASQLAGMRRPRAWSVG